MAKKGGLGRLAFPDYLGGPETGADLPGAGQGGLPGRGYLDFQDQPWLRSLLRPLLIAAVAASLATGLLAVLRGIMAWRIAYGLPLLFLAALEGTYSTILRGRPQWRDRRGIAFRLGELVALAIALRLAEWIFATGWPGPSTFAAWLRYPDLFFDTRFLAIGLVVLVAWGLAVRMTIDFLELAIRADEYAAQQRLGWGESASAQRVARPTSRSEIQADFARRWAWGAVLLAACAGATRIGIGVTPLGGLWAQLRQAGLPPDVVVALLCYFLGGLLLLSQVRLAALRGVWFNQGTPVSPPVMQRWSLTGMATLLLIALVAALLPLGGTGLLAGPLEAILSFLMWVVYVLFVLLLFLFGLLIYPLRFLFDPTAGVRLPRLELPPDPPEQLPSGLPDWLGGAFFWVLLAAIVAYLLFQYLRAHGLWPLRWVEGWRRWLAHWRRMQRAVRTAGAALRTRLGGLAPAFSVPARVRRPAPGRLGPRARVRYFYLSALRRAAHRGMPRPPERTPLEFVDSLRQAWPDAETDLETLTEAFVAARYARRPIAPDEARRAEGIWVRLMRALGRGRRPPPPPSAG